LALREWAGVVAPGPSHEAFALFNREERMDKGRKAPFRGVQHHLRLSIHFNRKKARIIQKPMIRGDRVRARENAMARSFSMAAPAGCSIVGKR